MKRWISRDPIGEMGGLNLYGFVGNGPINTWDVLGLWWWRRSSEPEVHALTGAAPRIDESISSHDSTQLSAHPPYWLPIEGVVEGYFVVTGAIKLKKCIEVVGEEHERCLAGARCPPLSSRAEVNERILICNRIHSLGLAECATKFVAKEFTVLVALDVTRRVYGAFLRR